jgi:hypothetical protein
METHLLDVPRTTYCSLRTLNRLGDLGNIRVPSKIQAFRTLLNFRWFVDSLVIFGVLDVVIELTRRVFAFSLMLILLTPHPLAPLSRISHC